jgi:hypothetical protein
MRHYCQRLPPVVLFTKPKLELKMRFDLEQVTKIPHDTLNLRSINNNFFAYHKNSEVITNPCTQAAIGCSIVETIPRRWVMGRGSSLED